MGKIIYFFYKKFKMLCCKQRKIGLDEDRSLAALTQLVYTLITKPSGHGPRDLWYSLEFCYWSERDRCLKIILHRSVPHSYVGSTFNVRGDLQSRIILLNRSSAIMIFYVARMGSGIECMPGGEYCTIQYNVSCKLASR